MCKGIRYIHPECQHTKTFKVIEPYNAATSTTSCQTRIVMHVVKITAPGLCVACFRRNEARIDAEYEGTKQELEDEIADIDESLAKGEGHTDETARLLAAYRQDREDIIVEAKASRNAQIRLFREKQGVWGDG